MSENVTVILLSGEKDTVLKKLNLLLSTDAKIKTTASKQKTTKIQKPRIPIKSTRIATSRKLPTRTRYLTSTQLRAANKFLKDNPVVSFNSLQQAIVAATGKSVHNQNLGKYLRQSHYIREQDKRTKLIRWSR